MLGLSFGEIFILIVVGIVVVGPRNLPTLMRTAGRWVAKLRRMSTDLRARSGIDDLIRNEGLEHDIHELRSLSRINVVDSLITPALNAGVGAEMAQERRATPLGLPPSAAYIRREPLRDREYPLIGCDAYEALADDAVPIPPDADPYREHGERGDKPPSNEPVEGEAAKGPSEPEVALNNEERRQEGGPEAPNEARA